MDKAEILQAIRSIADENGAPPGRELFENKTGVKMSDWYPHLWLRWGDALTEAGFEPNKFQTAMSETVSEMTVNAICFEPFNAAWSGFSPISM